MVWEEMVQVVAKPATGGIDGCRHLNPGIEILAAGPKLEQFDRVGDRRCVVAGQYGKVEFALRIMGTNLYRNVKEGPR